MEISPHLQELLGPLIADPQGSAVLLDVDGVLAPIVADPDDSRVDDATRDALVEVAERYGVVACVSGRRAADARRIVSVGSIAYLGSHGSEVLVPGATEPVLQEGLEEWARQVQDFAGGHFTESLRRLRVRLEDKQVITALHWRGATDDDQARAAVADVARAAEAAGLNTHWGRKVLEIRPPVRMDKGAGVVRLLRDRQLAAAMYAGDDTTDLDGFRGLTELVDGKRLGHAVRVGVSSREQPAALEAEADAMVDGTDGVRELLRFLLR